MTETYTFGLEEEYFLIDARTKSVAEAVPADFIAAAQKATDNRVTGEFLQSQIEAMTSPQTDVAATRRELRDLRQTVSSVAAGYGLAIVAAGTHPTASWRHAQQSEGERYDTVMDDLQMIGQRNMLCGLHVHVELPDPDRRVDVMTRMLPYIPFFIALGTSSPFWQSRRTGLKGYRLAAYDELPRTGLPELFKTREEFDAYIAALVKSGVIADSSYVWWSIRPSLKHPTLELRAPDCCTLAEDAIAIASLYRALARRIYRNPLVNREIDAVARAIIVENKWRAQRFGVQGTFVADDGAIGVGDWLDQILDEVGRDAEELGCLAEAKRCRDIVTAGTSADAQLEIYGKHRSEGVTPALRAVCDWLATATLQ